MRIKPEKESRQIVTGHCNPASLLESSEVLGECWTSLRLWDGAVPGRVLAGSRWKGGAKAWAGQRGPAKMELGPGTSESGEPSASLGVRRFGRESCHQGLMRAGAMGEGPLPISCSCVQPTSDRMARWTGLLESLLRPFFPIFVLLPALPMARPSK